MAARGSASITTLPLRYGMIILNLRATPGVVAGYGPKYALHVLCRHLRIRIQNTIVSLSQIIAIA